MKKFILMVAVLLMSSQAMALQQHSYQPLTHTTLGKSTITNSNNVIKSALQSPTGVVRINSGDFIPAAKDALDNIQNDTYLQNLIVNEGLRKVLSIYGENYGCKEWRFRNAKPAADMCGEGNSDNRNVEQVLFGNNGISVEYTYKNKNGTTVLFHAYSSYNTDRKSLWYGAHEIKGISSQNNIFQDTLLTVSLDIYKVVDGFRSDKLIPETMAVFLVAPKWGDIGSQQSEKAAGSYTKNALKILRTQK